MVDLGGDVDARPPGLHQPSARCGRAAGGLQVEHGLDLGRQPVVQLLDGVPVVLEPEDLAHHVVRTDRLDGVRAGLLTDPEHEGHATAVDQVVDHAGRDDLAAERVRRRAGRRTARPAAPGSTGAARSGTTGRRAGRSRAGRRVRVIFEYAASTASSLDVSPRPAASRAAISAFAGRNSSSRSSAPRASERADQRPCTESMAAPAPARCRASRSGRSCRAARAARPRRSSGEQVGALLGGEPPSRDRLVQQDLDVDLVVGRVHPGELSMASVLMRTAGEGELDAAELGQAEVAALADHPAAQCRRRRPGSRRWPCRRRRRASRCSP